MTIRIPYTKTNHQHSSFHGEIDSKIDFTIWSDEIEFEVEALDKGYTQISMSIEDLREIISEYDEWKAMRQAYLDS